MKITRISGHDAYSTKIAMACIVANLERQGRAVLSVTGDSSTAGVLMMCRSPVPFAIMLHDFNPLQIDLEALAAEPRMQRVLCFVEQAPAMLNDPLDDVLPITTNTTDVLRLISASAGILSRVADSEGGDHD